MADQSKILVIDDDFDIRDTFRMVLEAQGYLVASAASGAEGREAMTRDPADLIILDVMMEDADAGFVTAQWLKEHFKGVPVILLSSIADAADEVFDTSSLSVKAVINKPIPPATLIQTVAKLLAARA